MKLSEIPSSLYHSLRLSLKSKKSLGSHVQKEVPVVVSLTSIPSRLRTLHITIRSMMLQTYKPLKIVLWLHEDLHNQLPKALRALQGDLFEIRYSKYTFSHRKLIHSLVDFPEVPIITCDDDVIYHSDTIKGIYEAHLKNPGCVIGNKCREIAYGNDGVLSYNQWPFLVDGKFYHKELIMPVGAFCVLYPVGALHHQVHDVNLFMELAPRADDLWFKAMALKNGTSSIENPTHIIEPIPIMGTQFIALKKENKGQDKNRVQWNAIQQHFHWDKEKILDLGLV